MASSLLTADIANQSSHSPLPGPDPEDFSNGRYQATGGEVFLPFWWHLWCQQRAFVNCRLEATQVSSSRRLPSCFQVSNSRQDLISTCPTLPCPQKPFLVFTGPQASQNRMLLVPAGSDGGWDRGPEHGLQRQPGLGPNHGSTLHGGGALGRSLCFSKNFPYLESGGENTSIFSNLGL